MNRDDRKVFLRAGLIALFVILGAALAHAGDDRPSQWLCWQARAAVAIHGSEKAAEDAARARGVSEATIKAAKGCRR